LKDLRAWRLDSLSLQMLTSSFAVLAHSMAALRASFSAWTQYWLGSAWSSRF
ncbi:hypothetical protein AVEN_266906-2-1, partial [Araneus ventricosus]